MNREQRYNPRFVAKGLTLIELMVAISVLGVLATFAIVSLDPIALVQKTHDTQRKADLNQLKKAFELYYDNNGHYPSQDINTYNSIDGKFAWGLSWQPYMKQVPWDPEGKAGFHTARHYQYVSDNNTNNQSFCLYANLERGATDPEACPPNPPNGNLCPGVFNPAVIHCGQDNAHNCNFGVCSTNASP